LRANRNPYLCVSSKISHFAQRTSAATPRRR
jgi:hypothetical protein